MSSLYNEQTLQGTSYVRASSIHIDNSDKPTVTFQRERVINLDSEVVEKPLGYLTIPFDPTKEIPLLNPIDGTSLGQTVTHQEIYVALYSMFIQESIAESNTED